ncbi:MAG: twin-arginine translocase TatA/TatE family subunit [Magnetococcales bacterium]|nr:twin-arginine translocase TatA/TatE family subunit [Magnetococcales bacterium]
MLDMGWAELVVIMIVGLLAIGPEKLPEVAQGVARFIRQMQRLLTEVREAIHMEEFDARVRQSSKSYEPPADNHAFDSPSSSPVMEREAIDLGPADTPPPGTEAVLLPPEGEAAGQGLPAVDGGLAVPAPAVTTAPSATTV